MNLNKPASSLTAAEREIAANNLARAIWYESPGKVDAHCTGRRYLHPRTFNGCEHP